MKSLLYHSRCSGEKEKILIFCFAHNQGTRFLIYFTTSRNIEISQPSLHEFLVWFCGKGLKSEFLELESTVRLALNSTIKLYTRFQGLERGPRLTVWFIALNVRGGISCDSA